MNQGYNFKYERMRESDPGKPSSENDEAEDYPGIGYARNICFVMADRKRFFDYNYLVSVEYVPGDGLITLEFTSHTVALKGFQLDKLFEDLMLRKTRVLVATDKRYNHAAEKDKPVVNEIVISSN